MSRPLCAGKPPEWWTPGDPGSRLAVLICGLCSGCPTNDPEPSGVIRQGVGYSDAGRPLPECLNCGRPNVDYRGGDRGLCRLCAVPDVPIPGARGSRNRHIVALANRGFTDRQIASDVGLSPNRVGKIRRGLGSLRKRGFAPRAGRVAA